MIILTNSKLVFFNVDIFNLNFDTLSDMYMKYNLNKELIY